jgi:transforming growth factor-beta-induced protein
MIKKIFVLISFLLISNPSNSSKLTVLETISMNDDLSEFHKYLKISGLDKLLNKKLPWDWTIFAPNNAAFKKFQDQNTSILKTEFLLKNLLMDHMLAGRKSSKNIGESIVTETTVSNKPIQLYQTKEIHVKDMIVIEEDLTATNGIVHSIGCVMFVQPSRDDPRLTPEQQKNYPITSCCMIEDREVNLWKSTIKAR